MESTQNLEIGCVKNSANPSEEKNHVSRNYPRDPVGRKLTLC